MVFPRFRRRKPDGFTLVEQLVVISICSLVLLTVLKIMSRFHTKVQPQLTNRLFLQMEGRKLADALIEEIRQNSDIVRPAVGETTPFLVARDAENQLKYYYLTRDPGNSEKCKTQLFQLLAFTNTFDASTSKVKPLGGSVSRLSFTGVSPGSVQLNIAFQNETNEFQFLNHVGLMNIGDGDE